MPEEHPMPSSGLLHHVELWVPDLARAERSWGWLLTRLGAEPFQSWEHGRGAEHRAAYLEDEDGFEVELVTR
jgi:hypothetical protein